MAIDLTVRAGQGVRFDWRCSDLGVLVDPAALTLKLLSPSEAESSLPVVKLSTGVYKAEWDTTEVEDGDWFAGVRGSNPAKDYLEWNIRVLPAHTSP